MPRAREERRHEGHHDQSDTAFTRPPHGFVPLQGAGDRRWARNWRSAIASLQQANRRGQHRQRDVELCDAPETQKRQRSHKSRQPAARLRRRFPATAGYYPSTCGSSLNVLSSISTTTDPASSAPATSARSGGATSVRRHSWPRPQRHQQWPAASTTTAADAFFWNPHTSFTLGHEVIAQRDRAPHAA